MMINIYTNANHNTGYPLYPFLPPALCTLTNVEFRQFTHKFKAKKFNANLHVVSLQQPPNGKENAAFTSFGYVCKRQVRG